MGFFGGSSVDLTSPGPIGSTTPNTGAFTTLSATPPANTTAFNSTGYSLTGTNAQTLLNLAGTWNTTGTPTAIKLNVTDTASNASSLLMDLQVGGSSKFSATKAGSLILPSGQSVRSNGANYANIVLTDGFGNGTGFLFGGYNTPTVGKLNFYMLSSGEWTLQLNLGSSISWNDNSNVVGGTRDLILTRDSSNTLAQRNSTNAQTFRIYRTYTDASNYERLGFLTTNTTRYTITSQNAGTGSARSLEISFYTASSDPTSTDITSGCFSVWKNSGTGTIKLWANDGGTMKSVALA